MTSTKRILVSALAGAQAACFLLAWTAEALALPRCPHHHSVPALPAGHGMVAVHGARASEAAPGSQTAQPRDSHGGAPCTCIGICHGAQGLGLSDAGAASAAAASPATTASRAARDESDLTRFRPFSLPYSNAPPPAR